MEERKISELPNLPTALLESAKKRWNKTGPIYYERSFKFGYIIKEVKKYATLFKEIGVKPEDRIAIMMSNVPQFIFSYYGILLAGARVVPINLLDLPQTYKHISEIELPKAIKEQIKDSQPKVIVAYDFFYPILSQIEDELKKIKTQVVLTSPQDYLWPIIGPYLYRKQAKERGNWIEKEDISPDILFLKDLLSGLRVPSWDEFPGIKSNPDDIAQIQYTAGSTGIPKGVMITHGNILSNIWQCRKHMGKYVKDDHTSMLAVLPWFHVFGMMVSMNMPLLSIGAPVVLVPDAKDLKKWVGWIKKYKLKAMSSVPRLFERLGDHPELTTRENFQSIELFINGSSALHKLTKERFEELSGGVILEGYGQSETPTAVSVCTPDDFKQGSAGKPLPDTKIKILDLDTGQEIPAGTKEGDNYKVGEIVVKGPQVAKGYWKKPKETAETFKDGWRYTGDLGFFDKDNFLFITDRKDYMIKNLGEKVFPDQVEKDLPPHPYIKEIAVIGVADDDLEALVILSEEGEKNKETAGREILEFARQNLPKHEVPRRIIIVSEIEKNALGKVKKKKIQEDILNNKIK